MDKYKRDLMDRVLIDLYEKEAFTMYLEPSDSITGNDDAILQERLSQLARNVGKGGDIREKAYAELKEIFKDKRDIIKSYYNIVPFLIKEELIKNSGSNQLYSLRLTLEGIAKAKDALNYERALKNKQNLWIITIINSFLALLIVIATLLNLLLSNSFLSEKFESILRFFFGFAF